MVVEDERDIYELMLTMFRMWGVNGIAFADAEQAIDWIEAVDRGEHQGELPELAVIDIRLPGDVHGDVVGARLRASAQLADIAITMITAYRLNPDEEKDMFAKSGADHIIYKPLPKFNTLKSALQKVVAARKKHNSDQGTTAPKPLKPPSMSNDDVRRQDEARQQASRRKRDDLLAAVVTPLLAKRAAERDERDKKDK
jgi:CheY-like chemotaxis protein